MSAIAQIVGRRIRNYRLQKGLSEEKLAELAGCHPTYIGQIERGEKNATMESIEKIAIGLEIPLSQLFELLGGEKEEETAYAYRCYELVAAQEVRDQKQLYQIISEIEKYKKG